MSETIFLAQNANGACRELRGTPAPKYSGGYWIGERLDINDYPPPGECWEYTLTRKGDIDTDGDPIGWKIVGIGKDGSVLCEKGNGQRRRYSFADGAKEQPTGEAWERLTKERDEALRELANERASCGQVTTEQINVIAELQAELRDERASGDQVIDERNATIAELRSELDETRTERHAYKVRLRDFCQRLVDMVGADGPEDVQGMLDKVNAEIHRLKQSIDSLSASLADKEGFLNSAGDEIQRLTKERDEARSELRSLSTISGQTIAELRSELDETRTERHAYKSRLREFCQRLVDMVGAEGPEDVQGMLDKVNAELHRLKQNIDSMSANLADKEGFLNSAGDEIERLTKERDELRVTIDLDRANWDRVQDANYRTIAELQARLAKPEMPECVRELLEWAKSEDLNEPAKQIAAVEAHYAPPFRIDKLGVYATENGNPWEVIYIDPKGGVVARHKTTKLLENFHMSGACKGGQFSLTKYLRPLE